MVEGKKMRVIQLPSKLEIRDAMQALKIGMGYRWIRLTSDVVALGMPPNHTFPDIVAIRDKFVASASESDANRLEAALRVLADKTVVIP